MSGDEAIPRNSARADLTTSKDFPFVCLPYNITSASTNRMEYDAFSYYGNVQEQLSTISLPVCAVNTPD